ncbi:MAG: hypothetical protein ACPLW8_01140 [Candidatus Bathyarchaeales archaeon]
MKESDKTIIVVLLAIYVIASLALGSFNPLEWKLTKQPTTPTGATVAGMFDVVTKGYNTLDISSVLAENTAYHCYWYANRGGWLLLGKGDATIEVIENDNGFIYAVVEVPSGQSYYVDWAETKAKNPRAVEVTYQDPDNDGYKEFVFKFNMANIPQPASGNPKVYFYPYFLAYQQPSINQPADITGIGTSRVTKYVEWYLSFAQAQKAYAITKVEIELNTTDTTKVTLRSVNVPGIGIISSEMFGTPLKGLDRLTWTYSIGSSLFDANYIKYGTNQLNKFQFTTEIECQLQSSDVLTITITIYGLTTTGTLQTITDSVVLKAAS